MGGRKWLIVNLHKTTDGGVGRWLTSRVVGWGSVDVEPPLVPYIYTVYPTGRAEVNRPIGSSLFYETMKLVRSCDKTSRIHTYLTRSGADQADGGFSHLLATRATVPPRSLRY